MSERERERERERENRRSTECERKGGTLKWGKVKNVNSNTVDTGF